MLYLIIKIIIDIILINFIIIIYQMYRPFTNISQASKDFGVFKEPQNSGEYTLNKKAKTTYCSANNCKPAIKVGSSNNLLLFNLSNRLKYYSQTDFINYNNLNINLITTVDLSNVIVTNNLNDPTSTNAIITPTVTQPYLSYNIDPSGNLFGNNVCGILNYENYIIPNYNFVT